MNKKPLSKTILNWYGIGDCFHDMHASFKTYYWNVFLTSVAMVPLGAVAAVNSIVSTCEIFMSFFYGALIDGIKPGKWGRFRTLMLLCPPITAIVYFGTWLIASQGDTAYVVPGLVILSLVYAVTFNLQNTASLGIIPVICSTEQEKSRLSSRRWAWINFTKVILGYVVTFLLLLVKGPFGDKTPAAYVAACAIICVISILGMWGNFAMTKGYEGEGSGVDGAPAKKADRVSVKDMIATITKNPPLMFLFFANIGTSTVSFILAMMAAYQFNLVLEAPAMLALYLAITNIGATVGSAAAGVLGKKFESRKLSMGCLSICIIALIFAYFFRFNPVLFTVFIMCERTASSCNYPTFLTMYQNCIIYSEYKTGANATGVIMNIPNIPVKFAVLITGILIPAVLSATGYDATAAVIPEAVKAGLSTAITLLPICCYSIGLIIITFGFKLTRAEIEKMQSEIEARKANA